MNNTIRIGAILAGLAVVCGALGAHALKDVLSETQLVSYHTAVRYQMYHGLTLLFLALYSKSNSSKWIKMATKTIALGTVCFSGSIYLLLFRSQLGLEGMSKLLGPITPIGGVILIWGWICILMSTFSGSKMDKL